VADMRTNRNIEKPIKRSDVRLKAGGLYYGMLRRILWLKMHSVFASKRSSELLPFCCFSHRTPLLRQLKDVDMWMQYNKIINLKIAAEKIDGIIIRPKEVFSFWKLVGKPTKGKGYVDGMVLQNGGFFPGIGGGLCQMSNLIFWMAIHTPLTIIERHRHGYDVFPDSNRTQPFGSGATIFYPYGDLMIRNDTQDDYQLNVWVGTDHLEGVLRSSAKCKYRYEIVEKNHEIKGEYWGGYSRHNELYKQTIDMDGCLIDEELIVKNSAIMMYSPFLTE
jgi:vancomycin resistance protein VanW